MSKPALPLLTVAIPTYRRDRVLLDTLEYLQALEPTPAEILVLDQTEQHDPETEGHLNAMAKRGVIKWLRLPEPSITRAMNLALVNAAGEIVLFLDDDIRPEAELLAAHLQAHAAHPGVLVAGRVIQPWQEGERSQPDAPFHFATTLPGWIQAFMGGNFSVRRDKALDIGGFDENFVRVAYHFEAEFAHRFRTAGGRIYFEPTACLHHLKEASGGTRTYGDYLTTSRPDHSIGAYYCFLRTGSAMEFFRRPVSAVATRFHLRHPWRIPATLLAELRGMCWAWRLHRAGPRYANVSEKGTGNA